MQEEEMVMEEDAANGTGTGGRIELVASYKVKEEAAVLVKQDHRPPRCKETVTRINKKKLPEVFKVPSVPRKIRPAESHGRSRGGICKTQLTKMARKLRLDFDLKDRLDGLGIKKVAKWQEEEEGRHASSSLPFARNLALLQRNKKSPSPASPRIPSQIPLDSIQFKL